MVELVCSDDEIKTGQRVVVSGGHRGTIQYIGPVPPYDGVWLGIDWDDKSRGKHDGVHDGVRYFSARYPSSGSFVRKEKVDFGVSCVEAIKLRYGGNNNDDKDIVEQQLLQVKKAFNAPFLEMVGFDKINKKISRFDRLEIIWLHNHPVSRAGNENELKELCPQIIELHLSKTLLSDWHSVGEITKQLSCLTMLNLSENLLRVPEETEIERITNKNVFRTVEHIILTSVGYTWSDLLRCAALWPNVRHLQVPFNNIRTIVTPLKPILHNLRNLDLEGNVIEDWEQINRLGTLPLLECLNLTNTCMSGISITSSDLFPSLKYLILSHNNIASWKDINELNKLRLDDLKFIENPVLKGHNKETVRQLLVARIGSLKILNGQKVLREERRGAECDYIKRYGRHWDEVKNNKELRAEFIKEHGRYLDLIKIFGEAESSEYKEASTQLKSSLLKLEIVSKPTGQKVKKNLPRSMIVQRLNGLVQKLLNIGSSTFTIYVVSGRNPKLKMIMDNQFKTLDYYSLEDGDQIVVDY